jgi:DNA repair protein RecO (recombination protein O)
VSDRRDRVSRGLILRSVDYGEADRVITLLTELEGKLAVFATGAKKSKRRYAGALEPLRLLEIRYRHSTGNRLARLHDARVLESFHDITGDLHPLCWASLALEWTQGLLVEGQPSPVFESAVGMLRWMNRETRGPWFVEIGALRYALILLSQSGVLPALFYCVRSERPLTDIDEPFFSHTAGGLLAPDAVRPEDRAWRVELAALELLAEVVDGRFPENRDIEDLRLARRLVLRIMSAVLDKEPRSLTMLKTVWL